MAASPSTMKLCIEPDWITRQIMQSPMRYEKILRRQEKPGSKLTASSNRRQHHRDANLHRRLSIGNVISALPATRLSRGGSKGLLKRSDLPGLVHGSELAATCTMMSIIDAPRPRSTIRRVATFESSSQQSRTFLIETEISVNARLWIIDRWSSEIERGHGQKTYTR